MGKAGSGKTSVAELLEGLVGYERMSFAAPLKEIAAELWGDQADRDKHQKFGVAVRDIEENTWVNLLLREAERKALPVVVDDLRFPNEFWGLKAAGFVIVEVLADRNTRIDRLKANGKWQNEEQLEHISETALDGPIYRADYQIRNYDNKQYLVENTVRVMNRIRVSQEAW